MTNNEIEGKTAAMLADENIELRGVIATLQEKLAGTREMYELLAVKYNAILPVDLNATNNDLHDALKTVKREKTQIMECHAQKHAQMLDDIRLLKRCIVDYQAWQAQYIACNTMLQTIQQQNKEQK